DGLAGGVRARLERSAPRVRYVPRPIPAWTWAAAAVLVLGVVTPLTMVHVWSRREEQLPAPRPAALVAPTVAAPREGAIEKAEEARTGDAPGEAKLRRATPGSAAGTAPAGVGGSIPAT